MNFVGPTKYAGIISSVSFSIIITSPSYLDHVKSGGYYTFDIFRSFFIPHILSVVGLACIIYFANILLAKALANQFIKNILLSLLIIFIARLLISITGVKPTIISGALAQLFSEYLGLSTVPTNIRRAFVILVFIASLFLIRSFKPDFTAINRSAVAIAFVTIVFTVSNSYSSLYSESNNIKNNSITQFANYITEPKNRVILAIFDELDYRRLMDSYDRGNLKNLRRLLDKSINFTNASPPAWATALSIPSLLTGIQASEAVPDGCELNIKSVKGDYFSLTKMTSIFSDLDDLELKYSIIGFYQPYCRLYQNASNCISYPAAKYPGWWWPVWNSLKLLPGVDMLLTRGHQLNGYGMYRIGYDQISEVSEKLLADSNIAFEYIHFNFPHMPGSRLYGPAPSNIGDLSGYEINIQSVDNVIGLLLDKIYASKNNNILLIITSDHWLRASYIAIDESKSQIHRDFRDDLIETHKVPFIIFNKNFSNSNSFDQDVNTINIRRFIHRHYLNPYTSQQEIADWWRTTKSVKPITFVDSKQNY